MKKLITPVALLLSLTLHLSSCTPVLVWIQELEFDCLDQALGGADLLPDKDTDTEDTSEASPSAE